MMQCRARKRKSCAAEPRAQGGFGEKARTVWMLKGGSTTALAFLLPLPSTAGGRQCSFREAQK